MKHSCPIRLCLSLLAVWWACVAVHAEDYVLDFSTKAFSGTYASTWTWTEQGIEWELDGAYNGTTASALYSFIRFGGHGNSNGISYIKSNQPLSIAVKGMVMNVKSVDEEVKQFKLCIAEDSLFKNTVETVTQEAVAGEVSFLPQRDTVWMPDLYYKLEVHWNNPKEGNKVAQVFSLTFKEGIPPPVYVVTAVANDASLGTVSVEEKTITAVRGECVTYADPAWTVTEGEAEVAQQGDVFTVSPESDCTLQINFAPAEAYTVTLEAGGGTLAGETELVQADCASAVSLPEAVPPCAGWTFAGWAEASIEATEIMPKLIPAGEYLPVGNVTLYAVYQHAQGGEAEQTLRMMVGATAGWEVLGADMSKSEDNPYYILKEGAAIYSPAFDLATITGVSAVVRTYYGHGTLLITDEAGNEWGVVEAWENELFTEDGIKTQDLGGVGRLMFTSATTTATRGVGVAAITVYYRDVPLTYATYPDCHAGSGVDIQSLEHDVDWYAVGNAVYVETAGGCPFAVYDLTGNEVCSGVTQEGINRITLSAGCFLLRVGEKVQKIVITE